MHKHICPSCNEEFESAYESDRWCTRLCRENFKAMERKAKWVVGKPRHKPDPRHMYRLFEIDKPDDYGWG
jgi:hypothetical protein